MLLSKSAKRGCLLLLIAIIAFYFYGLGHLPFVGPDEPRYAQVAREMFLRGDLITPTLGGHTWFEKPVLLYWMMMLAYAVFGVSEFAARLGPAVCGVLTIISTYAVGRRVELLSGDPDLKNLGLWSAAIVATMPGIVVFSRGASFDIVVTMSLTLSLGCFLLALLENDDKKARWALIGFYVFMGVSLLAKGLIGIVIPLGVGIFYQILRRDFPKRAVVLSLFWGLPLALAVSAIWYGPVIARHGWHFIDQFFIQHHFARYVSNRYSHPQPVFFYLLVIFPLALPWLILTIDELRRGRYWNWKGKTALDQFRVFTTAWLLMPLIFFSFSGSKLPGYILPILPAAALLGGERLTRFISSRQPFSSLRSIAATLMIFAIGAVVYSVFSGLPSVFCATLIVTPLAVAGLFVLLLLKWKVLSVLSVVAAILLTFVLALNCDLPQMTREHSARQLIEATNIPGYNMAPVFSLHELDRGIEFYAAGRVVYDEDGQPVRFENRDEVLAAAKRQQGPLLVIVPIEHLDQVTRLDAVTEVIADNGKLAIVGVGKSTEY